MKRTHRTDPLEMLMRMSWLMYGIVLANVILVVTVCTMSGDNAKMIVMSMSFANPVYIGFGWFLEWLYKGYKEADDKFEEATGICLGEERGKHASE